MRLLLESARMDITRITFIIRTYSAAPCDSNMSKPQSLLVPLLVLVLIQLDQVLHDVLVPLLALQLAATHAALHVAAAQNALKNAGNQHAGGNLTVLRHPAQIDRNLVSNSAHSYTMP